MVMVVETYGAKRPITTSWICTIGPIPQMGHVLDLIIISSPPRAGNMAPRQGGHPGNIMPDVKSLENIGP
ncbi:hypothetical protein SLEP1_g40698 [Rubroshorea leprosula]|uniref:Uncharacterized protein n=1 Tax=Rubroshorea leprosula TaxID=152421 RepID=A0AAV5L5L0_9ROSI|nr:hypothetical protein SLEP1_g40698 [Rubroshorea leprosula]